MFAADRESERAYKERIKAMHEKIKDRPLLIEHVRDLSRCRTVTTFVS